MERTDELKERIRQQPLNDRLEESRRRIGEMCSQGRCPKMTIPVQHDDDDFYINTTLADAQATIAALQAQLTALRELVGQWAWNTTNLLGDYRIATVADFNAEWTRRSIWLIEAVQATLPPPQAAQDKQTMYELRQQVEALQAQSLKQAEEAAVVFAQLTQRTAELERVKAELNTVRRDAGLDCGDHSCLYAMNKTGMRTNGGCRCSPKRMKNDLERSCKAYDDLQAELERVRGERDHAKKMEAVQKEVADNQTWHVQKLRTLILALPKVDGEIVAQAGYVKDRKKVYACFGSDADMTAYAAIVQHRQGMEG